MRIVKVIPVKSPTCTIEQLKTGDTFIRGYHTLDGIRNGAENFSIYVRMPRSSMSVGDLPNAAMTDKAISEGRVAFNLSKGCCSVISANESLYRVDLDVSVSILV